MEIFKTHISFTRIPYFKTALNRLDSQSGNLGQTILATQSVGQLSMVCLNQIMKESNLSHEWNKK